MNPLTRALDVTFDEIKGGRLNAIPSNHSPRFAPVLDPTLRVGLQAILAAASAWLCA